MNNLDILERRNNMGKTSVAQILVTRDRISMEDAMIRVNELNYLRSPEYKEKMLLEKITNIYEKVKGKLTKEEILWNIKK